MTDQQILLEIQYHMLETPNDGASISSGMWTVDEVVSYLNSRQQNFIRDTGIIVSRATLTTVPNTPRHLLPPDWMAMRRAVWQTPESVYIPLHRMDWRTADNSAPDWEYNTGTIRPTGYIEPDDLTGTLEIQVVPSIQDAGVVKIWYLSHGATLDNDGIECPLPDECTAAIKWGAMADMLNKSGRAQDIERATYCDSRYTELVALTNLMMLAYDR